jgi:hypothetical protein
MNKTISHKHKTQNMWKIVMLNIFLINTSFQKFYNCPFKTGHGERQLECQIEGLESTKTTYS